MEYILIVIIWLLCGYINTLKIKDYPHTWFLVLSGSLFHIAVIISAAFKAYISEWNFKLPIEKWQDKEKNKEENLTQD